MQSRYQRGYILVTSLIFLVVLTLIAVTALDLSSMELKMSSNANLKSRGLESSEALRVVGGELLNAHVYNHETWPVAIGGTTEDTIFDFSIPTGISILDKDADSVPDNLSVNDAGESLFDLSSLVNDITLRIDGNGDGDYIDAIDTDTDLAIYMLGTKTVSGGPLAQNCGYCGLGKGPGGKMKLFQLIATGRSAGGAITVTSSEYRAIIP